MRKFSYCVLLLSLVTWPVFAEEEATVEGDEQMSADAAAAIYLPLKPSFVVNYGGPGRLKYLKVDVSVRLSDGKAANSIRHHLPYIRNNLVMLFASQSDESLNSYQGKESLRQDVLAEIKKIIMQEDRIEDGVVDVYFDSLIVQK